MELKENLMVNRNIGCYSSSYTIHWYYYGIILYKIVKKYLKNRRTADINTFSESIEIGDSDIVIYSRANRMEESQVYV